MKSKTLNEIKKTTSTNKVISRFSNLTVDTIRILGVEAIEMAKSGHPGIVLGAAPIMYALFREHMNVDVNTPNFLNRDRFVLSAGHGSALLYATMHLAGYKSVSLEDLKNFRKIGSKTAGHPENILIEGIDCTTGPLGQGVGLAVGMAIAETKLRHFFKKYKLFDHYTYCLFGDGCFEEGVFHEALSVAGKLKLNKLILIYDSNDIQLDGKTSDSTSIDTKKYFESLNLNYIKVTNGNDSYKISEAISEAKKCKDRPTVIEVKTTIGFGSIYQNSNKAHGNALNLEQVNELKNNLSYHNDRFEISKNAYADFEPLHKRGEKIKKAFSTNLDALKKDVEKYKVFKNLIEKQVDFDYKWFKEFKYEKAATRNICGAILQPIAEHNPLLTFLSADISSSTKVWSNKGGIYSSENRLGQNINVGVREFAMNAIASGISIHSGLKALTSTFLSFADYNKASIRLAAISHNPLISVFSHDSFSVGEDGPTHQPIEQLWSLRLIPNHVLFRPCNLVETLDAFSFALNSVDRPVTIVTSRLEFDQPLNNNRESRTLKGAYFLLNKRNNNILLLATGSEVSVAVEVAKILEKKYNIISDIASIPSVELFMEQSIVYRNHILGTKPVISIEFGSTYPWFKMVDYAIGLNKFGYSGPFNEVLKKVKLTNEEIALKIFNFIKNKK